MCSILVFGVGDNEGGGKCFWGAEDANIDRQIDIDILYRMPPLNKEYPREK